MWSPSTWKSSKNTQAERPYLNSSRGDELSRRLEGAKTCHATNGVWCLSTWTGVGLWSGLAFFLDQGPQLIPKRVSMRESTGSYASFGHSSIPRLGFNLILFLASLASITSALIPETSWMEIQREKGFIWSHLKIMWIYELDFSSTPADPLPHKEKSSWSTVNSKPVQMENICAIMWCESQERIK